MVRRRLLWGLLALASAAVAPELAWAGPEEPATDIAVVVPADLDLEGLTRSELREILLGNRRFWKDGQRIELVIRSTASPERRMFVERLSAMSELQFQQYWIGQVFRGRATSAPRAAPDRPTALALVQALPGALALVVAGELPSAVKALRIDGLLPGDPKYSLR